MDCPGCGGTIAPGVMEDRCSQCGLRSFHTIKQELTSKKQATQIEEERESQQHQPKMKNGNTKEPRPVGRPKGKRDSQERKYVKKKQREDPQVFTKETQGVISPAEQLDTPTQDVERPIYYTAEENPLMLFWAKEWERIEAQIMDIQKPIDGLRANQDFIENMARRFQEEYYPDDTEEHSVHPQGRPTRGTHGIRARPSNSS